MRFNPHPNSFSRSMTATSACVLIALPLLPKSVRSGCPSDTSTQDSQHGRLDGTKQPVRRTRTMVAARWQSEINPRRTTIMHRAPSLEDVRTVCSVLMATASAAQDVDGLVAVGAGSGGGPNDLLPVPVDISDLGGTKVCGPSGFHRDQRRQCARWVSACHRPVRAPRDQSVPSRFDLFRPLANVSRRIQKKENPWRARAGSQSVHGGEAAPRRRSAKCSMSTTCPPFRRV